MTMPTKTTPADPKAQAENAGDESKPTETTPTAEAKAGEGQAADKSALTQDKVDELIGKTRKEARDAAQAKLLKDLGIESTEAAKAALAELQKLKQAQMTEQERIAAEKQALEQQLAKANEAAAAAKARGEQALIEAEIISKASGRFANPRAVIRLLDANKVVIGEDGKIEGVDEALDALATAEPWTLIQKGAQQNPPLGATNPNAKTQTRTDDTRRAEYFKGVGNGFFDKSPVGVVTKQ